MWCFSQPQTVVCQNGVIACWHPEKSFPYEHSKSIDLEEEEKQACSGSVLSRETEQIAELHGSLSLTGPPNSMLREIFYTGKHEWKTR
ncbi:unnamed protein product [Gongylonema pulchrum]|uniref:Uncharacterized protein n=1 Tax=Gongylonema pulchrum TaxID=637853 RepID=A0A3P7NAU7_9BILA|nr:unnamed protein product [Gongylonema pulchrum]